MNLSIALESLWDARRRNGLALAGLAVGVMAVVAMVTMTVIVRREALRQFDRSGWNVMAVRKTSSTTSAGVRKPPSIDLALTEELATAVPAIERVAPVLSRHSTTEFEGRTFLAEVVGITEAFFDLNTMPLAAGRRFTPLDAAKPFVILGREEAMTIGGGRPPDELLGRTLIVNDRPLTVIGVLASARAIHLYAGNLNQAIFLPAGTQARLFAPEAISVIYVRTRTPDRTGEVAGAIARFLQGRVPGLGVEVTSAEQLVAEMQRQLRLYTILLGAAGALAFVFGGAGMMNSLLLAVAERRPEIGLRRALGATQRDIQKQFLYEALFLGAIGGLLGIAGGVVITAALVRFAGWTFALSPTVLALGLLIALTVGFVAGFLPAWQAARLNPADAIEIRR